MKKNKLKAKQPRLFWAIKPTERVKVSNKLYKRSQAKQEARQALD